MPTYEYRCTACGTRQDAVRRIAERDNCPRCTRCYGDTERRITSTMVSVFAAYRAVAADKETGERPVIRSKAEHEAFLRRNGYEEVGNDKSMAPPSMEEFQHRRAEKLKEEAAARAVPDFTFNEETHEATLEATP